MATALPVSDAHPQAEAMPRWRRLLLNGAVMAAAMIQVLDSTIANVAIPHMQSSLGATLDTITWVLTSFIIASVVAMPVTGWLADRFGSRTLFLWSVSGFILASMLCGAAANLEQMVLFRILQGVCAAFIAPLSQTIMLDNAPAGTEQATIRLWGMGVLIAPICGPMIGGYITDAADWRWIFYINLPIGIPALILLWWLVPAGRMKRRPLDIFAFTLLAIGLGALQLMLDRGQHKDWFESWEVLIEGAVAIGALWMFVIRLVYSPSPLFNPVLFRDRNFITALALGGMVGVIMYASFALLAPMMQQIYGFSVTDSGLLLAPRGLGMVGSMIMVSQLSRWLEPRWIIVIGFLAIATSLWMMTGWSLGMGQGPIIVSGVIQGFGIGTTFGPVMSLAFVTLAPHLRTEASSILYLVRSLGGSFGISATTTLLARGIQTSHEDLAGQITSSSMAVIDPSTADRFGPLGEAGLSALNMELNRQAAMIAYLSDFQMLAWLILGLIPVIMLLRNKPTPHPA